MIAAEAEIIRQEVYEGKDLLTTDPRKGVDLARAGKVGAVAAGATAAGGLAGAGALAGTAALGVGGAGGSAAVASTVGGATAGYTAGAGGALAEGAGLAEAHDRGAIGALVGSIGGVAGQGAGAAVARAGAGRAASAFAGGAAADYAQQQTLVATGLQEEASVTQSLAVGGASALTGIVAESTRGHGNPPRVKGQAAQSPPSQVRSGREHVPRPGDEDFIGPIQQGEKPIVIGKVRPYDQARKARFPGYEDHHLDPPLGRRDPTYRSGPTTPVRNDNTRGRVPGGENFHTARGGFQHALNEHIKELGYTRSQWNNLPHETRQLALRRFYGSLGIPYPRR